MKPIARPLPDASAPAEANRVAMTEARAARVPLLQRDEPLVTPRAGGGACGSDQRRGVGAASDEPRWEVARG